MQLIGNKALVYWLKIIFKDSKNRLLGGALLALATALSGIALLALSGWFITATALAGISLLLGLPFLLDIYLPGGGIRFFALSRTVSRYLERLYNHDTVLRQLAKSRLALFRGLQALERSKSVLFADADWLNRMTAELDTLDNLYLRLLLPPIVTIFALSFFCVILAFSLPLLSLVLWLSSALFMFILGRVFLRENDKTGQNMAMVFNHSRIATIEYMRGLAELRVSHQSLPNQLGLKSYLQQLYQLEQQLNLSQRSFQLKLQFLNILLFSSILFSVLLAAAEQVLTGPLAVMFILGWLGVAELLLSLPSNLQFYGKTVFAAERLAQQANVKRKAKTNIDKIQTLSLSVNSHPYLQLTRLLTLQIDKSNPWLLLTGYSGSGKSTLGGAFAGEITHPSISLSLNGKRLSDEELPSLYCQIAHLTQQNTVFADTLRYNLQLGLSMVSDEDIWKVLSLVELDSWANNLVFGLETWLGETGEAISGGQARRLNLARLLLREPQLIILDEPFNGLDVDTAKRVWQNIQPWLSQRYVVLMLHERPSTFLNLFKFNYHDLTNESYVKDRPNQPLN